jgi:putative AdoMet-dependent methyltransferase
MERPAWYFDDVKQTGVDFEDAREVEAYDRNQGTSAEKDRRIVERLGIEDGDVVIEFGCGTGMFALQAALVGADVHAVDVSQAMLKFAANRAKHSDVSRIQFYHAGFLSYAHEAEPADFVVTKAAFHHLPDFWKGVALTRMRSMMSHGAKLYLRDAIFSFAPKDYVDSIQGWIDTAGKPEGEGFTRADFEMHVRDEYSTYSWVIEGLLERTGFRIEDASLNAPTHGRYLCIAV